MSEDDIWHKEALLDIAYFIDRCKSKRKKMKYTQGYIASRLGITRTQYVNIERGTSNPSLVGALKLSRLLEVEILETK